MTSHRSFKSRVRARMDKTGESYTTARRRILDKSADSAALADPPTATPADTLADTPADTLADTLADTVTGSQSPPPAELIRSVRVAGPVLRERTGKDWDEWFALLDAWGATSRTHTEIARWLVGEHEVDGWWAQSVTVAYEQERGLRAPGQNSAGFFTANAGKTVAVPVERLFEAFADGAVRERWLLGELRVRTATAPRTFRADWRDGSTRVVVGFAAKGEAKAQVAVAHEKLPDAESAGRMKAFWRERLTALKTFLES
ncbi:hypothetical protein [Nonomuraea lactucae]|uniref:hypothetical protein n=1 Tax=Nonomuraea lactucae TaxID=2249762 RepID=UPI0019623426|nr:hypothetical protein [Nonomuraea lactucae]